MPYEVLTQEEQDEIMVGFLLSQERDEFCHSLNLERYEKMLADIPEGPWRKRIIKLRDETVGRLAEVRSILEATRAQLPPRGRIEGALARIKAREAVK